MWRWHIAKAQETCDRSRVDGKSKAAGRKAFQLRGKTEAIRRLRVEQWLDTEPIAHEMQRARGAIPQRDGEHAVKIGQRALNTATRDQFNDDLRVRGSASG